MQAIAAGSVLIWKFEFVLHLKCGFQKKVCTSKSPTSFSRKSLYTMQTRQVVLHLNKRENKIKNILK
jgi:hypothetical protein